MNQPKLTTGQKKTLVESMRYIMAAFDKLNEQYQETSKWHVITRLKLLQDMSRLDRSYRRKLNRLHGRV